MLLALPAACKPDLPALPHAYPGRPVIVGPALAAVPGSGPTAPPPQALSQGSLPAPTPHILPAPHARLPRQNQRSSLPPGAAIRVQLYPPAFPTADFL